MSAASCLPGPAAPVPVSRSLGRRLLDALHALAQRRLEASREADGLRQLQCLAELDHRTRADIGWPANLRCERPLHHTTPW